MSIRNFNPERNTMEQKRKAELLAEYEALSDRLLENLQALPVGEERTACVDGWMKMRAKVHKLDPDPCYKQDRHRELRHGQRMSL
jgi:hypothetical protein